MSSLNLIFLKSFVLLGSWYYSFQALKNLPISVISPFCTLSPFFTILLGVTVLNETIGLMQGIGILIIFSSYYLIGKNGATEITDFFKNKYLYLMVFSMFLVAISSLFDKFILKSANIGQVQFWNSLFVTIMFFLLLVIDKKRAKQSLKLNFSWLIPLMGLCLVAKDRIYFAAVSIPTSKISIILPLRRISVLVSVVLGGLIFKEEKLKEKMLYSCLLIIGVALILLFR